MKMMLSLVQGRQFLTGRYDDYGFSGKGIHDGLKWIFASVLNRQIISAMAFNFLAHGSIQPVGLNVRSCEPPAARNLPAREFSLAPVSQFSILQVKKYVLF